MLFTFYEHCHLFYSPYGNQGVLAQRRSNFQGNQFPMATEAARKAAAVPLRDRAFNRNRVPNWKPRYSFYKLLVVDFGDASWFSILKVVVISIIST